MTAVASGILHLTQPVFAFHRMKFISMVVVPRFWPVYGLESENYGS
jgi:hypothetical protein